MIEIKQYNNKWRLKINEEWEIQHSDTLRDLLFDLILKKENYGQRLKEEDNKYK